MERGDAERWPEERMAHRSTRLVTSVNRLALGAVWLYQGSVPKLFWVVPREAEIVERTGLYVVSPRWTLGAVGVLEVCFGLWLLSGYRERPACAVTTLFMLLLSVLVVVEEPSLLLGPFGGLIKNACLVTCAWTVWYLSGERER
jgi:uncharacterized membrane protein YphA (DoxX/SURF4 family)